MSQYGAVRHSTLTRVSSRARAVAAVAGLMALGACGQADTTLAPAVRLEQPFAALGRNDSTDVIPGQYIIRFRDDVRDAPGLAKQLVALSRGELMFSYTTALSGFAAKLPARAIAALQRNPMVASIEADRVAVVSDIQTGATWGLDRIDQRALPLDERYTYSNAGTGVNVYIIDTGIRITHAQFGGRAVSAYTAINDGRGTNDCHGHGTHVAGTVGGMTYGVAKGVRIYAVRVLDCAGSGTYSGIIAGVDWVTKNRALPAVANMSLGGSFSSSLNQAVQNSIKAGVTYAIAAGNSSADACKLSPASTPEAITVGAATDWDSQASFSNVGSCLDLFAPGWGITSAAYQSDTATATKSGTSMASPHVAGVAALYLATRPAASPAEVASAIVGTASANVLSEVTSGSPNRLLYIGGSDSVPATPGDTTAPPPPAPTDRPPVASFTSSCPRGRCTFDASGSTDDRGIISYVWDYGDGTARSAGSSLVRTTHAYVVAGIYTVTLVVTDAAGQVSAKSSAVSIKKAS